MTLARKAPRDSHPNPGQALITKDRTSLYEYCKVCPKTAHCCYRANTIVVLPDEANNLIETTGRPELLRQENNGLFTIVKKPGEACPFLSPEGLCGVYDVRPADCRSWPLTFGSEAQMHHYATDLGCPVVQHDDLSNEFLASAKEVLAGIPSTFRSDFVQLVHRDSLPLAVLRKSEKGDKDE